MSSYLLSTLVAMMFATQATPAPPAGTTKDADPNITLSGCVTRDPTTPGAFTFADAATGARYRMSGVSMRKYNDQRVEIVGKPADKRFTIRGGLYPSPNMAAQAGAIDPAQAAIANMPGGANTGTGDVQLPTFRVMRVRSLSEACH